MSTEPRRDQTERAEHASLLECTRVACAPSSLVHWPPAQSIDWGYLIAQADRHGVISFLADAVAASPQSGCPGAALATLRQRSFAIAVSNLSLAMTLRGLVVLLESHGVAVLPFKGPALAVAAYGDLAHRQFDDLDVIVRREDLQRVSDLLQQAGYRALGPRLGAPLLRSDKHLIFEHGSSGISIDVHWAVAPRRFGIALDERLIWGSVERVSVAGETMRAVPPDILLLMLCVHGARHEWRRLGWIADIAALIRRSPDLDWARLREKARHVGATRILHLGLDLAAQLLRARLPSDLREAIAADRVCAFLRTAISRDLFARPPLPNVPIARAMFHWRSRERLSDRCRYLSGVIVEPSAIDLKLIDLPASLSWLYYGMRPIRLAALSCLRRA